ncbi:uncharacterized protein TRIADDRAFT_61461 [Trichoplax adhaerens]|uniref:Uncharacterized protein n=1 Tax=Trichoplax adhaerens TaxID=10228 RepID=B3SB19_TRIAD|nr:hypothetical protein TRIADDRAFT_61461 [Trichoplax adhaerens]EDV20084.1 hypothetical protein TRIADDRAFT_61461 [Trichoplax adhaerens]|eukprot:XP_002117468.1 hypothetical protein TRIADDRAFT_61461 [Trichoplax adhaerens]
MEQFIDRALQYMTLINRNRSQGWQFSMGRNCNYNEGTRQLVNYILFDYCYTIKDLANIRIPEEILEDVVIFVKEDCVHVYCNAKNYEYLMPYIIHWRNLQLYCLSELQYEDDEVAEEYKICSFIDMVGDSRRIGIPYEGKKPLDPFVFESWPLIQAYAYEGIREGGSVADWGRPFVQFGNRLTNLALKNGFESKDVIKHGESINRCDERNNILYMICKAIDPRTKLICIRTYFLSRCYVPHGTADKKDINKDARKHVEFHIECYDNYGRSIHISNQEHYHRIKLAYVAITDIPSLNNSSTTLGSVAFAETFVDSVVRVYNSDNKISWKGKHLILTRNVPKYFFHPDSTEEKSFNEIKELLQTENRNWGKKLALMENVPFVWDIANVYLNEEQVIIFERCIIIICKNFGTLVLSLNEIEAIKLFDGDSTSTVAILLIKCKSSLLHHLPIPFIHDNLEYIFALPPKSKARREFYNKVLNSWNSTMSSRPQVEIMKDLQQKIRNVYDFLQSSLNVAGNSVYQNAAQRLYDFASFWPIFEFCNCATNIKEDDIALLQSSNPQQVMEDTAEIIITVITGIPGCGKESLCTSLTSLAKENNRWMVLRQSINDLNTFKGEKLQERLSNLISKHKNSRSSRLSTGRRIRLLLETSGFTDIVDVIQAILSHPDKTLTKNLRIGAVTACLDHQNCFMEGKTMMPKLLEFCATGLVNNIVFHDGFEQKDEDMLQIQKLIRTLNVDVAFIAARSGKITRSIGAFASGQTLPAVTEHFLKFNLPLDKAKILKQCKDLRDRNSSTINNQGKIYHIRGLTELIDVTGYHEIDCCPYSQKVVMQSVGHLPTPPKPSGAAQNMQENASKSFMIFSGTGLDEGRLKQWLTGCRPAKPKKKVLRTKESLTSGEVQKIRNELKAKPLPAGCFYNGLQYQLLDFEQRIEEYLKNINARIEEQNRRIDAIPEEALF